MQILTKWIRRMASAAHCSAGSQSTVHPWGVGSTAQDKPWFYQKNSRRVTACLDGGRTSPPLPCVFGNATAATATTPTDAAAAAAFAIMLSAPTVYHSPRLRFVVMCGGVWFDFPSIRVFLNFMDGLRLSSSNLKTSSCSIAPMMDWTDNYFRTLARLMTRCSWLYTEMVVAETIVHQADNLGRFLDFDEFQHPIVLQIGGNNPVNLAKAAQLASPYGYDEINLNCGCPSEKVAGHCFGASLMLNPVLVGQAMAAIAESCDVPVTVKCRIGVDDFDSYEELYAFVSTVASMSPTKHFVIHARKAILKGLSPAENRNVPPLKYEYVYALIRDFPNLKFTLNGGVTSLQQAQNALQMGAYGVMIGRAAYNSPWTTLGNVDSVIYGETNPGITRRQIVEKYALYADVRINKYGPKKPNIRTVVKPLLHLFHAEPGASTWRRAVDEALSIKKLKTIKGILAETLKVIPDFVLDAPPQLPQNYPVPLRSQMQPLPERPIHVGSLFSKNPLQKSEELEAACS